MSLADGRLVRRGGAARGFLLGSSGLGVAHAGLVIAQAGLLAHLLVALPRAGRSLAALLVVVALRAVVSAAQETLALQAAARVKSALRRDVVGQVARLGPSWIEGQRSGELATLLTHGLDAIDAYFSRFLPQLILAVAVPLAVLARVLGADWVSALVIAATLPLIPLFMALVGLSTAERSRRQWRLLERLGGHFLDAVDGLTTLKVFGRSRAQVEVLREYAEDYRHAAFAALRVTFLSTLVLELAATLSTAVVAVEVGLRLLGGSLPFETALVVLLLAPEAYLPLRTLGTHYHASLEGAAALKAALDVVDIPAPDLAHRVGVLPELRTCAIVLSQVSVAGDEHRALRLVDVSLRIEPGELVVLAGPSGAGKSTLLDLVLGLIDPTRGAVALDDGIHEPVDLDALDRRIWWSQVGYVRQRTHLFAGSIADNVRLGRPEATDQEVESALARAGAAALLEGRPDGIESSVGERGRGLSSGERQRVSIARAFLADPALLILDEPTAHLDPLLGAELRGVLTELSRGRTVLIATHDAALAAIADRLLWLDAGTVSELPRSVGAA